MKRNLKSYLAVLALILGLMACKDEAVRKAARASDDMAVTVGLAIDTKRSLAASGLLKPEEEIPLTLGLQKVNASIKAFHAQVKRTSVLDQTSKPQLALLFSNITSAVAELNEKGVLGIKDPEAKAKVTAVLAGFTTAFAVIQAVIGGV
jgi:hypothetical protein